MRKVIIAVACATALAGCSTAQTTASEPSTSPSSAAPATSSPAPRPTRTTTAAPTVTPRPTRSAAHSSRPRPRRTAAGPTAAGLPLPDPHLTPGSVFSGATTAAVCTPGWSAAHRDVTSSERYAVFAAYGIPYARHSLYELDHLVPLEVGGDNSTTNLWPEPQTENDSTGPDKDALENHLHALVCSGRLPLQTAQQAIATNWVAAWHRYESASAPAPRATRTPNTTTNPASVVGSYYAAINAHEYSQAWRLGGRYFATSYAAFVQGFQGTDHDILRIVGVGGETVQVDLTAYQSDGSAQHYTGTYTVSGGTIVGASIHPSESPAPSTSSGPRPGEFCATEGQTVATEFGLLVCEPASDGRDRWRHY